MTSSFHTTCNLIACVVSLSLVAGCADAPGEQGAPGVGTDEALSFDEAGEVLFEHRTPEGDWLTFYGFEDGSIATVGRLREEADPALRSLVDEAARGGDLTALYRTLSEGRTDAATLARLQESDARSAEPLPHSLLGEHPVPSELAAEHDLPALLGLAEHPEIETRASSGCFQSDSFYSHDSDGWARHNCVTVGGVPNALCQTNRDDRILDDWHRVRHYRATAFNQTRCNQAVFTCSARWTTHFGLVRHLRRFFAEAVGPRQQFICFLNTTRDNLDASAVIEDVSGPERGHLCMATNRRR